LSISLGGSANTVPFETTSDGVKVRLRLTPGASKDHIKGVATDENHVACLTASVTAAPEDGRANKALIRMLSKEWRVAKSSIRLVSGQTDRRKVLLVEGDAAEVSRKLTGWLKDRQIDKR
jgi:uncharacterized protein